MNKKTSIKPKARLFVLVFGLLLFSVIFSSCNFKAEHHSEISEFSVIDSLITHNQIKDASKELKKLSKKTYEMWTGIGVFKRYLKIDDKKSAEKIINKFIKKHPENLELKAVYSNYLIRENRFSEAAANSKQLLGSKYGSIYAEAILREAKEKSLETKDFIFYAQPEFLEVYKDSYNSTGNSIWLRDCAIINLLQGKYGLAIDQIKESVPSKLYEVNDAYFWALALYDAKKYDLAITAIEKAKYLLKNYENKNIFKANINDLISLESDCYILMNDYDSAENNRRSLISGIEELNFASDKKNVLPVIYMDSALYALNNKNIDAAIDYLFVLVSNWPDYIPGLLKYADVAYEMSLEKEDDFETKILRDAGIKSLEMEKYEFRRKIPVSDAIYRVENTYKKTKDQKLQLKLLDLKFKTDSKLSNKEKSVEIWKILENNISENIMYSEEIVEYALDFFIEIKQFPQAFELFSKFIITQYDFLEFAPGNPKYDANLNVKDFFEKIYSQRQIISRHFLEYAAWFAIDYRFYSIAENLYSAYLFENDDFKLDGSFINTSTYSAVMNYANMECSLGNRDFARDIYVKLAERERKASNKAEIFYRLANIYTMQGDVSNAKRAVDYATTLYPDNVRAQLLKVKLTN